MKTRKEYKKDAITQLGGGIFKDNWLMMVLAYLIFTALISISIFGIVGPILVTGPLTFGLVRIMTRLVKREDNRVDVVRMFDGFRERFGTSVILSLIEAIFTGLWSLLLIVPGFIATYAYSLSFYILEKNPDKDWDYCHKESIKLMKGHKWDLFVLDLSFIGWYIIGALCFGVGTFFVAPYHLQTRANFLYDLLNNGDNVIDFTAKE